MITLSRSHPSRIIRGCARELRATLFSARIFGRIRFADLAAKEADEIERLCKALGKSARELEMEVLDVAADGIITPCEVDRLIVRLRKILNKAEAGRVEEPQEVAV